METYGYISITVAIAFCSYVFIFSLSMALHTSVHLAAALHTFEYYRYPEK